MASNKWLKRLFLASITGGLMAVSFVIGVAITAVFAIALVLPIGLAGLASTALNTTVNSLYTGDSETRLAVLHKLQGSFENSAPASIDPQMAAWILPAIEQCQADPDPAVVNAATELAAYITTNTNSEANEAAEQ